jgi:uncharacterized protein (DUF983 family)
VAETQGTVLLAALRCRCPRCGQGPVFSGLLTVRQACPVCALDLTQHDAGDGPAVAVTLVLGAIIVALAFWVEFSFEPPFWVHVVIWPTLTLPLAVLMMRPLKAALIAQQYYHRRSEMERKPGERP